MGDYSDTAATIARVREKQRMALYARRMGLSLDEAYKEPAYDIEAAFYIWSLDNAHATLEPSINTMNDPA